ncbi:MAG: helix-turn-helix domain-containing protein [Pseudomonadota bacterium]
MDTIDAIDLALRGGAAGLCLLSALQWSVRGAGLTSRLAALFAVSIFAYSLLSSPVSDVIFGPTIVLFYGLGVFSTVFFWWFALALFEYLPPWRPIHAAPFLILAASLPFRGWGTPDPVNWFTANSLHQMVVIALLGHVIYLALSDFTGDLVAPRRRFRLAIATLIPAIGFMIAAGEIASRSVELPRELLLAHAAGLLLLSGGFVFWTLHPKADLLTSGRRPLRSEGSSETQMTTAPGDQIEIDHVMALMEQGCWREEGLTIGVLAERANLPEHRLRRLINQHLGFRNFASFLNSYRLPEAQRRLADPVEARTQIVQLALELGYGSVGPFGRAFKAETGLTPTEYRRRAVSDSEKLSPISKE